MNNVMNEQTEKPLDEAIIRKLAHFYQTILLSFMRLAEEDKLTPNDITLWIETLKAFWAVMNELGISKRVDLKELLGGEWIFDNNLEEKILAGKMRLGAVAVGTANALK